MPLSLIEKYIGNEEPKHGENHPEIVFEHGINHLLTSRQEIIGLLKKIYRNHSLLTVSFDDKEQRFGSAILEINTENNYLVIDEFWPEIGNSETLLKKKLDISTYHAGINMHFNNAIEEIAEKLQKEMGKKDVDVIVRRIRKEVNDKIKRKNKDLFT